MGRLLPSGVIGVPTEYLTTRMRSAFAEPGGRWLPQHANSEVGRAYYLLV